MIDICAKQHQGWRRVLNWTLKQKQPIRFEFLELSSELGIPSQEWKWLTSEFWTFLGETISKSLHLRRKVLAGGEEDNGLEIFRRFSADHEGGAAIIQLGGRRGFPIFPRCQNAKDLTQHIDNWWVGYQEHGSGLPSVLLFEMFLKILPHDVEKEIRREKGVTTHHDAYAYVMSEQHRLNNERLAKSHEARRDRELASKPGAGYIHAAVEDHGAFFEGPINALEKKGVFQKTQPPPRRPPQRRPQQDANRAAGSQLSDPRWRDGACWHCGANDGQKSKDCPVYSRILAANGRKKPADYQSAYDKEMAAKGKTISAVASAGPQNQASDEHELAQHISYFIDRDSALGPAPSFSLSGTNVKTVTPFAL